jgi:hypothetical protein
MCKLNLLKLEKNFYEKLYKDLFFNSKNKNSCLLTYYKNKLDKINKKINLLNDESGDVIYFKNSSLNNNQPYFI